MTSSICDKKIWTIDIGNTSTHFAYYNGATFSKQKRVSTKNLALEIPHTLPNKGIQLAAIASVVPKAGAILAKNIRKKFGIPARLIGRDIQVPIVNLYSNPKQVGVDRLLNSLAAYSKYKSGLIVVDFGTAITFDVVSNKGEYLGGVIAPGIQISIDALFNRTALLPKIKLAHPKRLIGKNTIQSIQIGCSVGIGGLCDRIIDKLSSEFSSSPTVIATGGYAQFMSKYCRHIRLIDPWLVMRGIVLAAHQQKTL